MNERYLYPVPEGKWAIRRNVGERWIDMIQDWPMDSQEDAEAILRALHIVPTEANLNLYFPSINSSRCCPTLELMEMCNVLDPTNPHIKQTQEHGV